MVGAGSIAWVKAKGSTSWTEGNGEQACCVCVRRLLQNSGAQSRAEDRTAGDRSVRLTGCDERKDSLEVKTELDLP